MSALFLGEKKRRCLSCGREFTSRYYDVRFCGETRECERDEQEYEAEASRSAREAAEADDYERYR